MWTVKRQTSEDSDEIPFAVVRNKCDLDEDASKVIITKNQTEKLVKTKFGSKCAGFSTSAKVRFLKIKININKI